MSKIPKSYNATPTFAGLVAKGFEGKGTTTLVPWASLEKTPGPAWPVCDKNGVRILHNGRPVVLFANGDRQSRLARRLYLRHLEPGWKSGELTFTISCANEKRCLLLASGVCLALGLGLALAVAPKLPAFWSPDPPFLEYKYLVLSRAVALLPILFSAGLICLATWLLTWVREPPKPREIRLSREGLLGRFADGSERFVAWDTITNVRGSPQGITLDVLGQQPITISGGRAPSLLWRYFFDKSLPRQVNARRTDRGGNTTLRICVYLGLGAMIFLPAGFLFADRPQLTRIEAGILLTAIYGGVSLCLIGLAMERTIRLRLRRLCRPYRKPACKKTLPAKPG